MLHVSVPPASCTHAGPPTNPIDNPVNVPVAIVSNLMQQQSSGPDASAPDPACVQVANVSNLSRQQQANNWRLFDNFDNLARSYRCPAVRAYHLEGNVDEALIGASDEYGVGLMGLQVRGFSGVGLQVWGSWDFR